MATQFTMALSCALEQVGKSRVELKPEQEVSIRSVFKGRDVFVWLLTGFGKSRVNYQLNPDRENRTTEE